MFELVPLSAAAIPAALAKAERYRLLNESGQAESICLDVLAIDPDNQEALAMMILAITDQFRDEGTAVHVGRAERLVSGLRDAYTQAYTARSSTSVARARHSSRPGDDGVRVAAGGASRLRPRHRPAPCRQRRRGAALECLRARAPAPAPARPGGSRESAIMSE